MGWSIECGYPQCLQPSWASNIVELIGNFCDGDGLLVCPHCKKKSGYIGKKFDFPEEDETSEPILRGVMSSGQDNTYQPFVFPHVVSADEEKGKPASSLVDLTNTDIRLSYYKDLRGHQRADGGPGRLKMGYGPGSPPVLASSITQSICGMSWS